MNEDTRLLLIPKNKNAQKYQNFYLATQMEHDQSSIFAGTLTIFAGALPPWAPPW